MSGNCILERLRARLLVRGWLSANSVLFSDGHDSASVIDTGYASHAAQTVQLIDHALGPRHLARIVNTHLHSDHCGGNAALQRRWATVRTCVPSGYQSALHPWNESQLSYRDTGQTCPRFEVDGFLRPGELITLGGSAWQVHAARGHDNDALMFFEPAERVLISGDALWEHRLAIIFPELVGETGFAATLQTLDAIERLAPRLVLPGHGSAFTAVAEAIDQSRRRVERFASAPGRHRAHAVRALVMFHMLELGSVDRTHLQAWIAGTPIFQRMLTADAAASDPVPAAASEVIEGLLLDGALRSTGFDQVALAAS